MIETKRSFPSARALMREHGVSPRKALGQNFLIDDNIIARIVESAQVGSNDTVVEIGPGLGALTFGLARLAKNVIAVDADSNLARVLNETLQAHDVANVQVLAQDALDFDLHAAAQTAGGSLVVVGNLPYHVTSPLLFHVLDSAAAGQTVRRALFMVQKEVADRMAAPPGNKTYGRLSIMVQQYAEVRRALKVGTRAFVPPPAVLSSVVELIPRAQPLAPMDDAKVFDRVVRSAFSGRRKMMRNALEALFGRERGQHALQSADIDGRRRAETLSVQEFAALSNAMAAIVKTEIADA